MTTKPVTLCGHALEEPGHVCAFFSSKAQEYEVLAPYYAEGIGQGEQVITLVDGEGVEEHRARLQAHGIEVDASLAAGSLKIFTSADSCLKGGPLTADRMCNLLQGALSAARRAGRRVRTSGVMDWATGGQVGADQLIEFEARINLLLPVYECTLLCVYDLDQLNAQSMMEVLATHPLVIQHRQVLKNPYYRPPIELLAELLRIPMPRGRVELRA